MLDTRCIEIDASHILGALNIFAKKGFCEDKVIFYVYRFKQWYVFSSGVSLTGRSS